MKPTFCRMEKDKGTHSYRRKAGYKSHCTTGLLRKDNSFYCQSLSLSLPLPPTSYSCWSPESVVTRADAKKNNNSKNMLMTLSTLPVLQFHSIICTFSPDFHDFRTLFIKYSIINQAPSLTVLMRLYLQHPSPMFFSTPNPHSYYI